jgi:hypothetical protein
MQGRYGDSITRAGERTCVYEIDMVRGKGASKDAPTPYLELQGLAALRRTCRPCLAGSGRKLVATSALLPNLANTFHLLYRHHQEFHPPISCIASPSLHLAL